MLKILRKTENNNENNKLTAIHGIFIAVLFVIVVASYVSDNYNNLENLEDNITAQENTLLEIKQELTLLEIKVGELIGEAREETKKEIAEKTALLEIQLEAESEMRLALETKLENETGLSSARLYELENTLGSGYDLTTIIKDWRLRTANITCNFPFGKTTGSGVLVRFFENGTSIYGVLTNQHVLVSRISGTASSCAVEFPDYGNTLLGGSGNGYIEISTNGYDFGRVVIENPDAYLRNISVDTGRFCSADPLIGDEIIILGYPQIGSNTDITATEGIVSGFDGDYFITSAKVEQGNSGGTAVLLRSNCLLGIPTFVQLGSLESLARILDINVIGR